MADWFLNLRVSWMALIVFVTTYLIAGGVYLVVTKLALTEWAQAFKAVSPGMLPPLGILFALLVGFIAVEVWNNLDKAKAERSAQPEMVRALHTALDARRQRIVISESAVGTIKWVGILLEGLCTLIAIAGSQRKPPRLRNDIDALCDRHRPVRPAHRRIAAYSRPFMSEISAGPELLKQVHSENQPLGRG